MRFDYPFRPLVSYTQILIKAKDKRFIWGLVIGLYLKFLLFEPLRWLEIIFSWVRQTHKTKVIRPVFILGHWRSGTTHLQTLITAHGSFASMNVFQAIFPDQFFLTEPWLKPVLQRIAHLINYQNYFHQRPMDLDEAQEEELAFTSMGVAETPYWARVLGRPEKLMKIDHQKRKEVHYRWVQKLQRSNRGKRLVLKSPPNLLFLPEIMEAYPDAQFIFIYRDPVEVYHSTKKLWKATHTYYALSQLPEAETHNAIIEDYIELMEAYKAFKDKISPEKLIEVNYHELKKNETFEMAKVWEFLGESPLNFPIKSTYYVPQKYETPEDLLEELKEKWGGINLAIRQ